ncbi:MAG: hypothetical protein Q9211_001662 [Gyalolechia sp. 1 TL-2023]
MDQDQELNQFTRASPPITGTYTELSGQRKHRKDAVVLARLGKKQVLKRRFGFLSLFGFSCTILITWETVLAWVGDQSQCQGQTPTKLWCSIFQQAFQKAPIAGGQYFWTSILAPKRYRKFLSYITGWLTSLAWIATLATGSIFVGTIIQGLIILNYPNYDAQKYQGTFLCWAVIAVAVFVNTVVSSLLPVIEGLILVFHVLGFVAIMITLVTLAPHGSASDVFQTVLNGGNWPTQGLSFCVGFIGNVATFVGADASVHMSEEIENAAVNVPRAIFSTMVLNGSTGFAMALAVLFCLGDPEKVLETATGFPFIQVFYNGTQSKAGATVMTALVVALAWSAVIGFLATASRMVWSFARDKGLPFHKYISKVDNRNSIPVVAIILVTIIPCLLALIYIGSSTVFEDVVSLSVSGLYASYFVPCSLLLWRRSTGQIRDRSPQDDSDEDLAHPSSSPRPHSQELSGEDQKQPTAQPLLVWGPWRVPGVFGTINNVFACIYIVFVLFWSFWPPATPATAENMNYSVLVTGSVIGFSIVYYFARGKREYKGPLIDREVLSFARHDL